MTAPKWGTLLLITVLLGTSLIQAAPKITQEETSSTILFPKIGQLIPEISFVTIKTVSDLKNLVSENSAICNTAQNLQKQLKIKLQACKYHKGQKHTNCNKDYSRLKVDTNVEYK